MPGKILEQGVDRKVEFLQPMKASAWLRHVRRCCNSLAILCASGIFKRKDFCECTEEPVTGSNLRALSGCNHTALIEIRRRTTGKQASVSLCAEQCTLLRALFLTGQHCLKVLCSLSCW
ncbi:hypothetical protein CSUI_001548 [Cystoisospora suis]|uniref:Uncharacterized protein n=1 Tax=Cystoisospora suis TaxID=483139 RepID=A0A2C6LBC5_9APIC|nr:hypothetical protein CSUI_001548 [Cystoisospora suis]